MKRKILTDCSDCRIDLTLDLTGDGQVIAEVPSNGRRGSKRVEAYTATSPLSEGYGGALLVWDCPVCGYADSYEVEPE